MGVFLNFTETYGNKFTFYMNNHYYSNGTLYYKYLFRYGDKCLFGFIVNTNTTKYQIQQTSSKNCSNYIYGQKINRNEFYSFANHCDLETFKLFLKKNNNFTILLNNYNLFMKALRTFQIKNPANSLNESEFQEVSHNMKEFYECVRNLYTEKEETPVTNKENEFIVMDGSEFFNDIPKEKINEVALAISNSIDKAQKANENECLVCLDDSVVKFTFNFPGKYFVRYYKNNVSTNTRNTRNIIKQVKLLNADGFSNLIKGNFYDYTENMKNNNYIVINGINVNKNRVKFIDVYSEPPVSNADALKQINPVS